ncbi:hypothetical protein [Labrys sp. 22185]|uniref:hypothetical protein n=1 Tax=Labrys sp. 22185 TaxID=3453888 RepID=UPI003F877C90
MKHILTFLTRFVALIAVILSTTASAVAMGIGGGGNGGGGGSGGVADAGMRAFMLKLALPLIVLGARRKPFVITRFLWRAI